MIKLVVIDKTLRHLGLTWRKTLILDDMDRAIKLRDDILSKARDYGSHPTVVIVRFDNDND